jgi:PAS domain S-box-containing protein
MCPRTDGAPVGRVHNLPMSTPEPSEQSKELFRLVVEKVRDFAVYTKDLDGYILSWNPGVERLLGYAEDEWVGRHVSVIFTPGDLERGALDLELETALEKGCSEDQRWHVRKDGSRFWANGLLMLLRDEDGPPRAFAKIMRDDTARHRAEEELRRAHDELERRVGGAHERAGGVDREPAGRGRGAHGPEAQTKELLRRVVDVQEVERRRMARDLHDNLGQQLTALNLALASLREMCGERADLCGEVGRAQAMLNRILGEAFSEAVRCMPLLGAASAERVDVFDVRLAHLPRARPLECPLRGLIL